MKHLTNQQILASLGANSLFGRIKNILAKLISRHAKQLSSFQVCESLLAVSRVTFPEVDWYEIVSHN